jgi:hypothetical protein
MASTQLFNSLLSLRVAIQKYGLTQHVCTRHREQLADKGICRCVHSRALSGRNHAVTSRFDTVSDVNLLQQHSLFMRLVSIDRHAIDRHTRNLTAQQSLDRQEHIIFETDTPIVQMHSYGCVTIPWLTRLAATTLTLPLSV